MTFQSPERLWLLLAVAALLVAYLRVQRRRSTYAVRFTALHLLDKVAPDRPGWRRHLPAALHLGMLTLLVLGFARPSDEVRVPRERATVVVAVDVSNSMRADDVVPSRLDAARTAAGDFVRGLPERYSVGLVAFAGEASTLITPVRDRPAVLDRIESLSPEVVGQQGTAIGEAIAASLASVRGAAADADGDAPPARVVLLSDGANTAGRDPDVMAAQSAELGLPVDTISFGTPTGEVTQGEQLIPVPVDGATLRQVAEATGGSYHEAATAQELDQVYADITGAVGYEVEQQDVSARFIGAGLVLALLAAAGSLLWFSRLP